MKVQPVLDVGHDDGGYHCAVLAVLRDAAHNDGGCHADEKEAGN